MEEMKINLELYTKNNSRIFEKKKKNEYPQRVYILEMVDEKEDIKRIVEEHIDEILFDYDITRDKVKIKSIEENGKM